MEYYRGWVGTLQKAASADPSGFACDEKYPFLGFRGTFVYQWLALVLVLVISPQNNGGSCAFLLPWTSTEWDPPAEESDCNTLSREMGVLPLIY